MKQGFDGAPLYTLTVGEFIQVLDEHLADRIDASRPSSENRRLVYGLKGIQDLFGCSHKAAQHYKDHVIRDAVSQNGRKIVVDADLALKLFNQKKTK